MKTSTISIEEQLLTLTQQLLAESGEEYAHRHLKLDSSLQRHLGIDSLGRAELFARIEKQFGIQLPQQLLAEAETLNDILKGILSASPEKIEYSHQKIIHTLEDTHIDPSNAKTLIDVLLLYATQFPERPHIYLQNEQGKEEVITYGKLLDMSLRIAFALLERGLRYGDTVAIMQPTNPGFFYTFYGVLLAGCIPVPIYPPFRPHQIEAYAKQEAGILTNAEVRLLVTFQQAEKLSQLLRAFVPSLKDIVTVDDLLQATLKAPIYKGNSDDLALIQYTSGSTSAPKGVMLTYQNLLANIRAYGKAIQITSQDVAVSWTPLYHDLGLIGMWFGSLYHGVPLIIMSPLTFLSRPEKWLWAMHYHRGTISGGPNFAYELCVRKINPAYLEGLDLSSWRLAFNGAEPIQPKTLERFTQKFSAYGFKNEVHFPVYGLAESAVCVATSPLNRGPRIDVIEREAFEVNRRAVPVKDNKTKNALEFVACGKPIPDHAIRIVDETGKVLPERQVGQLQFKGPSSMQGYLGNSEATKAIYHEGGWWDTGDFAYIADEEVFITGRIKDLIIKAGRNLYAAEIEELTGQVPDIRKGCIIAFGVTDKERGTEKLIIVAETREKNPKHREAILEKINDVILHALDIAPDQIILVKPQVIPKTSSGKLQRSACKQLYLQGELGKNKLPASLQVAKLAFGFMKAKVTTSLQNAAKLLYTTYVAILLGVTLVPVFLSLWLFSQKRAAIICRAWARLICILAFCPILFSHKQNLFKKSPLIFAMNHSSYVDALLALAIVPAGTLFIGKSELAKTPIIRVFIQKLGAIVVDRMDTSHSIQDSKKIENALLQGHSVVIFPEGTFSYAIGLRPFKLGAFKLAAETHTPICPIVISGSRWILRGEERLAKPHFVKVIVGEPIMPEGSDWQEVMRLKQLTRDFMAKNCGEPTLDFMTTGVAMPREE